MVKKYAFIFVLTLAVAVTALTAGFTNALHTQQAVSQAALAATDNGYDFAYPFESGTIPDPYIRIIRLRDLYQWDTTANSGVGGFVAQAVWGNTAIRTSTTGNITLVLNSYASAIASNLHNLPPGTYYGTLHNSASPAATDAIIGNPFKIVVGHDGTVKVTPVNYN